MKSNVTVGFLLFFYRVFYDKNSEVSVVRILMFIGQLPKIEFATVVEWKGIMNY